jgi:glutamate formiminotransferase/formiminotetrahydrofolate cyclodeaminase
MKKLVECVPNFSEGRDPAVINAIAEAVRSVAEVSLLDVDAGADTNRTIYTFVGEPEAVLEAAFRALKVASARIDMSKHRGAHPRMGAADVTPFVPVSGATMEDCVALAQRLGERVGRELSVPVYLYEAAASVPERRNLADVRSGEYEGLAAKVTQAKWKPDFGPAAFHAKSGAFIIGARQFLIAYNVNLNTRSVPLANDIAFSIRELGRLKRDAAGEKVVDANGNGVYVPGKLKAVKAVGWEIPAYGRAQVSINLIDFNVTPLHVVMEAVREEAARLGLVVTGSELIGLIPREALLAAGRFYLRKQGRSCGVPERELYHTAVLSLGLAELTPFDVNKKVVELAAKKESPVNKLVDRTVRDFVDECSMDSPVPGGGSVAALCAAQGAALACMVANLTVGKKSYEKVWEEMKTVAEKAQALKDVFLDLIDRDSDSFAKVTEAWRLPKATPEQTQARTKAIEDATKGAALVPLEVMQKVPEAMELALACATKGNKNSASDAGVAGSSLRAASEGAWLNVRINLTSLSDKEFVARIDAEGRALLKAAQEAAAKISAAMG